MATQKRKMPVRSNPWDRLKPHDFVVQGRWPTGKLGAPAALRDSGLSDMAIYNHVQAIGVLTQLVIDFERYLTATGKSGDTVMREVGLGENTIRDFRSGNRMPSSRTYLVLRAYVPSHEAMNQEFRRNLE